MVLLDANFPEYEQFPRQMEIEIVSNGNRSASTFINRKQVGDPLWDCYDLRNQEDFYRYHDVFHLTNIALLGWSPTFRGLLQIRRKSDDWTYKFEDGPRARAVDEGIIAFIFSYGQGNRINRILGGKEIVDSAIIARIKDMTENFEVRIRTPEEWERAIKQGFRMWNRTKLNSGIKLYADLERGIIESESDRQWG